MPHRAQTALDLSEAERAGPSRWAKSAGRALAGPGRSRPRAPDAAVGAEDPAPAWLPASAG